MGWLGSARQPPPAVVEFVRNAAGVSTPATLKHPEAIQSLSPACDLGWLGSARQPPPAVVELVGNAAGVSTPATLKINTTPSAFPLHAPPQIQPPHGIGVMSAFAVFSVVLAEAVRGKPWAVGFTIGALSIPLLLVICAASISRAE